jgi:hypothetical protein
MRKATFTVIGVLLIAGSAVQMVAASERHTGRSHHRWDRTYNQVKDPSYATPQAREDNYGKPPADVTRSCDVKWCYAD